jgi:hypothetical protein
MAIQRQTFKSESAPAGHQGYLPYMVRSPGMPFRALAYISNRPFAHVAAQGSTYPSIKVVPECGTER